MTALPTGVWRAIRAFIEPYTTALFTVPGEPCQKARARHATTEDADGKRKTRTYTDAKTAAGEKRVARIFDTALPGWQPDPDRTWGVLVDIHTSGTAKTDIDNILKLILDALNKRAWLDDLQVGMLLARLDRGHEEERVEVGVFEVEPNGTPATKLCACGTRYRAAASACNRCRTARKKERAAAEEEPVPADPQLELLGVDPALAARYAAALRRRIHNSIAVTRQPTRESLAELLREPAALVDEALKQLLATGAITQHGNHYQFARKLGDRP